MLVYRMLHPRALPVLLFCVVLTTQAIAQTTVQGEPFGYVKVNIARGSGTSKSNTMVSIPLFDTVPIGGQVRGTITGVGTNTLSNSSGGWTPGELSNRTNRFLVHMTSGEGAGRMFLIGTNVNTANTVTIDSTDIAAHGALNTLGITAGDKYQIHPCDTIGSLFGTPSTTGVSGGTNLAGADGILLTVNGVPANYFYHTLSNRWVRSAPGFPDATHQPIHPYTGFTYSRISSNALSVTAVGRVPTASNRVVPILGSGPTVVSQYWPVATAISNLGFDTMSGWAKATTARNADRLIIATSAGAVPQTYFFHSSSNAWVENRPGFPLSGSRIVPVGSSVTVNRASNAPGSTLLRQPIPYSLQ
jgi:hypothetical protein